MLLPEILPEADANWYFNVLVDEVPWKRDEIKLFGKTHIPERHVCLMGEEGVRYKYSGVRRLALPWSPSMKLLRDLVVAVLDQPFNSCLLNYYPDGNSGMGWHADNEPELGLDPTIAVISLGAERRFSLKDRKTKERTDLHLPHGSLFVMKGTLQKTHLHALPKSKRITEPRISLTFRNILC